jgi:hypothetical protein
MNRLEIPERAFAVVQRLVDDTWGQYQTQPDAIELRAAMEHAADIIVAAELRRILRSDGSWSYDDLCTRADELDPEGAEGG